MLSKSTFLHLRFAFSYFLLPIFLFALSVSPNLNESRVQWVFLILHFMLYPASNGYNSYFDKDEGSIGGLKNPPPVSKGLYWAAILLDTAAVVLGYLKISLLFALMLIVYGLVSKAYSHPSIRLKKMPWTGWFVTGLFQGAFTFSMCYVGINDFDLGNLLVPRVLVPATLSSLMLWANYPMTQVYQHEEDRKHGDMTLSLKLGINGTFYFAACLFILATAGFVAYFNSFFKIDYAVWFVGALTPVLVFFGIWMICVRRNAQCANYSNTMWLNVISATCLNVYFIWFFLDSTQVGQYIF